MQKKGSIHPVDEQLSIGQTLMLAFQHALIAILAAIPVPAIVQSRTNLDSAATNYFLSCIILASGISSLLCSIGPKKLSPRMPMIVGASFSMIPVCINLFNRPGMTTANGFRIMAGATIVAGIVMFLVSSIWSKLMFLFPLVVVATNTVILGIYLMPNVYRWIMADSADGITGNVSSILLALFVFALNLCLSKFLKGFLANLNVLFCFIIGTIVAYYFNLADFSALADYKVIEPVIPFVRYGTPTFDLVAIISFSIVSILSMVEISGTSMGLYSIVGKKMDNTELRKTLSTAGVNTAISGIVGAVQPVPFVQTLGLLDMTKVFSRFTVAAAGILLVVLSFFPKTSALINAIPKPVLAGASLSLFAGIISSGINLLHDVDMNNNNNKIVVGFSMGVAMIPAFFPGFYGHFPQIIQDIFGNGILAGGLSAIILNLIFNFKELKKSNS